MSTCKLGHLIGIAVNDEKRFVKLFLGFIFFAFSTAPLVKIKQALQRLKNEVTQMDVRLGVVEQSLIQAKLKDKSIMQKDMNKPLAATFES